MPDAGALGWWHGGEAPAAASQRAAAVGRGRQRKPTRSHLPFPGTAYYQIPTYRTARSPNFQFRRTLGFFVTPQGSEQRQISPHNSTNVLKQSLDMATASGTDSTH